MRGHEYIREAVRTYFEQVVPARLQAHLTAIGMSTPVPAEVQFVLADGLQDIVDFPVVVIRSTDATNDTRTGDGKYRIAYDVEVIVACDHRVHGDGEAASKDRDRLLLAVREAVYSVSGLTDDIDIAPSKRPEATGAAMETRSGVPLAAGTIKFTAYVLEDLEVLDPPETITNVDLTATAYDAGQAIP